MNLFKPLLIIFTFFIACTAPSPREVSSAFYHWQTHVKLTSFEKEYLKTSNIQRIYVKFFDVDWDAQQQQAIPLAAVQFDTTFLPSIEIIPTVFITNRTLFNLPEKELEPLAQNILQKIQQLAITPFSALQFDCDWTPKTQKKYFHLLALLHQQSPHIQLSATIRLHQVKYFKRTGVPPVNRGMLMFYNMGDLEDIETDNSILDPSIGKTYLQNFEDYPLPLDVALPIFQWGVLFRDGRMIRLINELGERDLQDTSRFSKIAANRFQVVKSTYLQGHYLYQNDELRLEKSEQKALIASAKLLTEVIKNEALTLTFYHLDTATIKRFSHDDLQAITSIFERK